MKKKLCIVYQSNNGHTEKIARAVQQGILSVEGAVARLISVNKVDDAWDELANADAIIFGAPTYMGSVPAEFKKFMDDSSKVWATQGWKEKIAAGFTCSACWSGDKLNTLVQMAIFAAQHSMIWVPLGLMPGYHISKGTPNDLNRVGGFLGAMAQANADESADNAPLKADLDTAFELGKNVAKITEKFSR